MVRKVIYLEYYSLYRNFPKFPPLWSLPGYGVITWFSCLRLISGHKGLTGRGECGYGEVSGWIPSLGASKDCDVFVRSWRHRMSRTGCTNCPPTLVYKSALPQRVCYQQLGGVHFAPVVLFTYENDIRRGSSLFRSQKGEVFGKTPTTRALQANSASALSPDLSALQLAVCCGTRGLCSFAPLDSCSCIVS